MCKSKNKSISFSFLLLFSSATPGWSGTLSEKLINYHRQECDQQSPSAGDLRMEKQHPEPSKIVTSPENYYTLKIIGQQGYAEVLMLEGRCGEDDPSYCGSGGCFGYIIFEDQLLLEFFGGRPFVYPGENKGTNGNIIMFPKSAAMCQVFSTLSDNFDDPGCFGVAYWDGHTVTSTDIFRPVKLPPEE